MFYFKLKLISSLGLKLSHSVCCCAAAADERLHWRLLHIHID
jgi:hypothetical protein